MLVRECFPASVVQLNKDNFNQLSSSHEIVFINFYADWCRFSQILTPIFEEAYNEVLKEFPEPSRVLFAKVDCEVESEYTHCLTIEIILTCLGSRSLN